MYKYGQGVPSKDLVQEYKWVGIAVKQGQMVQLQHNQTVTSQMTPIQIEQAEKLIEDWKPKKPDADF
jgi:hypothetical protein